MHITPYKAMYFPNFIFLRKRLKSSHTSLKKLEKEDFNSINRYFISSLGDASAFVSQGSMPWQANTIHFLIAKLGHRPPTWQCRRGDASPPSEDASPAYLYIYVWNKHTYIYTCEMIPFMFFNTKHKKIILIICSFKAESVLLPCYSFPAKKSLKKVSFFKSLVYNDLRI